MAMQPAQRPTAPPIFQVQFADNQFLQNDSAMVIYGDSGIGKTTIAATMPNPLFLIMRGGGEHRPAPLISSGIPFIEIFTKAQIDAVIMELKAKGKLEMPVAARMEDLLTDDQAKLVTTLGGTAPVRTMPYVVKTIIVDQLTSMYNVFMNHNMEHVARNRENKETPNQQDYGQARKQFLNFMFDINNVPNTHKVYLSLSEIDKDVNTQDQYGAPMIPGKLAKEVLAFVDFVFRMHTRREMQGTPPKIREFRAFQTNPEGIWLAKDSTGRLPKYIEIPNPKYDFWNEVIVKAILK